MTPQDIEQMTLDREAGTPGPWADFEGEVTGIKASDGRVAVCSQITLMHRRSFSEVAANARRIARVPDMEAEILRLRSALEDISNMHAGNPSDAMAEMSEADYARYILTRATVRARRALEGYAP